jgi:hypothetical protein
MEPKKSKERSFSLELRSKSDLKSVSIPNGSRENVLVEGIIGELVQIRFTDGVVLEIMGRKGVLRIDVTEDEVKQSKMKEPAKGGETDDREN